MARLIRVRLAAFAVVVTLLAGCSTSPELVRVSAPPASHDAGARANRDAAEREARRLLTLTDVPPGAKPLHSAPPKLDGPGMGTPSVESLVDAARFWSVPMTFGATMDWFTAHPPRGHLSKEGTSSGGGPGFQSAGLGYWAGKSKAWQSSELEVSLLSGPGTHTYVRVDGVVVWLDPTPVRDPTSGRRIHFAVAQGCPAGDRGVPGVTNQGSDLDRQLLPAGVPQRALVCLYGGFNRDPFQLTQHRLLDASAAAAGARELRALPLSHVVGGVHSCPGATGMAAYIAFDYAGGRSIDVAGGTGGCSSVRNGHILVEGALPSILVGVRK